MAPIDEVHLDDTEDIPQARSISCIPILTDREPTWLNLSSALSQNYVDFHVSKTNAIRSRLLENMV